MLDANNTVINIVEIASDTENFGLAKQEKKKTERGPKNIAS